MGFSILEIFPRDLVWRYPSGVLLLSTPPSDIFVKGEGLCPTGFRESGQVAHPGRPSSEPFCIKGFMIDFFQGFCDEAVVCLHSVFCVQVPQVFGEGDEGAENFSFKTSQVLCTFSGYVP